MASLDAGFKLEKWMFSNYGDGGSWKVDTSFDPIPLEATLVPGEEAVHLTPVDA